MTEQDNGLLVQVKGISAHSSEPEAGEMPLRTLQKSLKVLIWEQ